MANVDNEVTVTLGKVNNLTEVGIIEDKGVVDTGGTDCPEGDNMLETDVNE